MSEPLADQVEDRIAEAAGLFYRLVLVVAPSGSGKTAAVRHRSETHNDAGGWFARGR